MAAESPQTPSLHRLADRLETLSALDRPAGSIAAAVRRSIPPGPVKDALSGTWLGHPLHPLLTDVALAAWVSAGLLDITGGKGSERAADRLVGSGIAAAVPTALTGLTEWGDTAGGARRIGLLHAVANSAALALYSGSYLLRRRGRRRAGVAVGLSGAAAVGVGAYLGGHLSYSRGIGVNRTAFQTQLTEWTAVAEEVDLADGQPTRAEAGGVELMLLRQGADVLALSNRCSHRGGELHAGKVDGACVVCPLHGSIFSARDGSIVRGPASAPQPAYETRVRDGRVEVRLQELHRKRES